MLHARRRGRHRYGNQLRTLKCLADVRNSCLQRRCTWQPNKRCRVAADASCLAAGRRTLETCGVARTVRGNKLLSAMWLGSALPVAAQQIKGKKGLLLFSTPKCLFPDRSWSILFSTVVCLFSTSIFFVADQRSFSGPPRFFFDLYERNACTRQA